NFDLEAVSINTPISNCGLTPQEVVDVTIKNIGFSPISNFPITYVIDNGTPVTETVSATINPDDTYTYTFNQGGNFSTVGIYELRVYPSYSGDLDVGNDTVMKVIEHIAPVLPDYSQDFESGANHWVLYGTNSSMEIGAPAGNYISSAYSGTSAAVSNFD